MTFNKKKVSFIFGTRPEAIKLCPVILNMRKNTPFEVSVCVTGQHREMLDQIMTVFGIKPNVDLNLMLPNQALAGLTSRAIDAIDAYLCKHNPDLVIVQGDTTTVFCAGLAAFYHHIPVGHVEAGLRTWNYLAPYPEEMNRVLATRLTKLHFAPTTWAQKNLLNEGVRAEEVFVTGNPVIDALNTAVAEIRNNRPPIPSLPDELTKSDSPFRMVLITGHRRESFGQGFENICLAILTLSRRFPDTMFVYPVHLNPNVREPVFRLLGKSSNVYLVEPLSYLPFIALMERCTLVLTDSGGIQEEAPSLGKPVLVMREVTERPEGIEAGTVKLVGTEHDRIVANVSELLSDESAYRAMSRAINPYGDGKASERIVKICERFLDGGDSPK